MPATATLILPLATVALFGFLSLRLRVLSVDQAQALGRFLVTIALPALMIGALAKRDFSDLLPPGFTLGYLLIGLALGLLCWVLARRLLRCRGADAAALSLGVMLPNSIIIAYPLSRELFSDSLDMLVAVLLVENLVFLPLALVLFERAAARENASAGRHPILRRLATNPIMLAIALGALLAALGLPLPGWLDGALALLGSTVSGLALFFVGTLLAQARIGSLSTPVLLAVGLRLLAAPGLALVLVHSGFPGLDARLALGLLLFSASPSFSVLPVIAAPYGAGPIAAAVQALGTGLAMLTIPLWLAIGAP